MKIEYRPGDILVHTHPDGKDIFQIISLHSDYVVVQSLNNYFSKKVDECNYTYLNNSRFITLEERIVLL